MTARPEYFGCRSLDDAPTVVFIPNDGPTSGGRPIDPCLSLMNHSPTGFNWGYLGSGPAQLALAILVHCTQDNDTALALYQEFKEQFIAPIQVNEWRLPQDTVREWVNARRREVQAGNAVTRIEDEWRAKVQVGSSAEATA